jgi:nucleoside-diphosphate-sugar epimerase
MIQPQVLITGAAGFLGGRLAKALAQQGYQVRATSRRSHRQKELAAHGVTFMAGDLTDAAFCQQVTARQELVVHCAALSSPWGPYSSFYAANQLATQQLVDAARRSGVRRLVNFGTPSIYANYQDRLDVHEGSPLPTQPINHYAATKLAAESYVLQQNGPDFETISLRPRAIVGAEDQVIFPRLIRAYQAGRLRIIGAGDTLASLSSVPNVVHAVDRALRAPAAQMGQAYNLADAEPVRLWEEINFVLTELGHAPITRHLPYSVAMAAATLSEAKARWSGGAEPALTRYGISVLTRHFTLDVSLAQSQLGYQPTMTSREGLREFLAWYPSQAEP